MRAKRRSAAAAAAPVQGWPEGFLSAAEDRRAWLVLATLEGTTPRRMLELAAVEGSASACLARIREGSAGSDNDTEAARATGSSDIAAAIAACGARLICWGDPDYPAQLGQIPDPPGALFVRGGDLPDPTEGVAIVGSRTCSDLGRELARDLGRGLAEAGATVVSGAARGIDAAAHEGALDSGGRTVAVLGCGVDVAYPPGSRSLLRRIAERGTVASEYAPGARAFPYHFPARNRIVAGLCAGTVVVEGADGSGSKITAEHAMEFGRDVYAVPGAVTSPLSHVPLALIRDGATMIRGVEDLLADLRLDPATGGSARADLTLAEAAALERLTGPTLPEAVARVLGVGVPDVLALLLGLEMKGLVRTRGGRFEPTLAGASARAGAARGPRG